MVIEGKKLLVKLSSKIYFQVEFKFKFVGRSDVERHKAPYESWHLGLTGPCLPLFLFSHAVWQGAQGQPFAPPGSSGECW